MSLGRTEFVKALLHHKVDANVVNKQGWNGKVLKDKNKIQNYVIYFKANFKISYQIMKN